MPKTDKKTTKKKRVVGKPFKPGQSGNPSGSSKKQRARREGASILLEKVFAAQNEGDVDLLVEAIRQGVVAGESAIIKIACEYRWGKPVQLVDVGAEDGSPLEVVINLVDKK